MISKRAEFGGSWASAPGEFMEGVRAPFNADMHGGDPSWAPREGWFIERVAESEQVITYMVTSPESNIN